MNKKAIIGTTIYIATRPKPLTDCEILLTKQLDAKTQDELNFAEKQWRDLCVTKQS